MKFTIADISRRNSTKSGDKALQATAKLCFLVMATGQWIFAYYIMAYYGALTFQVGITAFADTHLPGGYIPGDTLGNAAVVSHVFIAVILNGFGPLQLIPQIRARFLTFHRWNGRVFLVAAVIVSIAGLYMTWLRDSVNSLGNVIQHVGTSIGGVLVIIFAAITLHFALARDFKAHSRWALRLFMVVSAVWFSRIMLWAWVLLTDGIGIDWETFTGPTLTVVYFAQWFLPLAILELYFYTQHKAGSRGKQIMAVGLFLGSLLMGIGVFAATKLIWLPNI